MKFLPYSLLILVLLGCSPEEPAAILIRNVAVIDAESGARAGQSVLITGKTIEWVGPADQYSPSIEAREIDGNGKYLIPGLWDTHVHLSYEQDLSPAMFDLFLVNGVTSIRDTGGQLDLVLPWKEMSMADDGTTPRVMIAGPLLDGVPTVYNGEGGRPKLGLGVATPDQARTMVTDFVSQGVDLIKSYEMLTPESFMAVVDQASQHDKVVTGHVPLSMDVIDASNMGLRSMEHLRNLEMACAEDHDSLLMVRQQMLAEGAEMPGGDLRSQIHSAQRFHAVRTQQTDRRAEVLRALKANNTWQVPTLTIVMAMTNRVFDREDWLSDFRYLPEAVNRRWTENAMGARESIVTNQDHQDFSAWAQGMVGELNRKEIGIMAGTDTPIFFLTPGFSLHEELRLLVESGMSPMDALEAATLRPAEYFSLEATLGTINAGKFADLLLLDANPLEDINNTKAIQAVIKSGRLYDRQALDGMLRQLESN